MIGPDLRDDCAAEAAGVAAAGAAGADATDGATAAGAGRGAAAGAGGGAAGAAGRGAGAGGGVGAGAAAEGAVAAARTTPQWTQNFAPGWFSLPQAAHFIDGSSLGNSQTAASSERPVEKLRRSIAADRAAESGGYYGPIVARLSLREDDSGFLQSRRTVSRIGGSPALHFDPL
jgi:hypothetical protein